ncbi:hypothetical protein GCM10027217_36020 [Pseudomaricurvus hydrocarbonicus]
MPAHWQNASPTKVACKLGHFSWALCLVVLSLIGAHSANAETFSNQNRQGLPHSFPKSRSVIDASKAPWNRIGSLSIAGRQFCTATLVADNLIITAAHCLWNAETSSWYPSQYIHFLAGYQRDTYSGHSTAKRLHPNPEFNPRSQPNTANLLQDWALVELQQPLGKTLGAFNLHASLVSVADQTSYAVGLAGYRSDAAEAMSLDQHCQLLPRQTPPATTPQTTSPIPSSIALPSNLLLNNCHGLQGDSGAPLLKQDAGGEWQLIGIHVARVTNLLPPSARLKTALLAVSALEFYDTFLSLAPLSTQPFLQVAER